MTFGSAAIGKARSRRAFEVELVAVLGKFGRVAALTAVAVELALSVALMAALVMPYGPISALASAVFVIGASLYVGFSLVATRSSECRCWGGAATPSDRLDELPSDAAERAIADILRPVWYAARNAALVGAALALAVLSGLVIPVGFVVFAAAMPIGFIGVALVLSIWHEHRLLRAPEHPLLQVITPRARVLVAQLSQVDNLLPAFAGRVAVLKRVDHDRSALNAIENETTVRDTPVLETRK